MGVDEIVSKILEDANKEAEEIIEKAKAEAEKILEEAKKEAERRKSEILKKGEKEAEMIKNRIIAEAKLEVKKRILKKKEELIEMAIRKLREELMKLPERENYRDLLIKLIVDGAVAVDSDDVVVDLNRRDYEMIDINTLWEIERKIERETNRAVVVRKGSIVDIVGGAIVRDRSSSKICNNSLEAIFERNLENIRTKIAQLLF
ncbi:MAG TPA: V-type ATP synthase subunit E [Methanothermococcus okinawensis]|uniref:A-type ATP synthase subunit E n=1 Tax=Methanothermococcus okinawensis TaxID=155863 RepID=A0A832ZIF2_9EURY|nr:V-type ATP synthase subunit E [Methanothermococcus okinawensis]HIP90736.1 V-type ATP synthase subunit E [Methanothermococcus okinawensis]